MPSRNIKSYIAVVAVAAAVGFAAPAVAPVGRSDRRRHGADGRPDHQRQPYHRK
jgi:hypothetical protein